MILLAKILIWPNVAYVCVCVCVCVHIDITKKVWKLSTFHACIDICMYVCM